MIFIIFTVSPFPTYLFIFIIILNTIPHLLLLLRCYNRITRNFSSLVLPVTFSSYIVEGEM